MEKLIENVIDTGLESISTQLYAFSIGLGMILIILGIILFFINKGPNGKKAIANGGLICLVIGIISVINGFVQI